MKTQRFTLIMITLLQVVASASVFPRQRDGRDKHDWPHFLGPHGNGISDETGLLKSWPEKGPEEIWRIPIGTGYSGLAISNGRIYTMDGRKEKFEFDPPQWWYGFSSSPFIDQNALLLNVGGKGNRSIAALDKKTGFCAAGQNFCFRFVWPRRGAVANATAGRFTRRARSVEEQSDGESFSNFHSLGKISLRL